MHLVVHKEIVMGDQLAMSAIKTSLDGLATRSRAIADNVANIQTPGYASKSVEFEAALKSAFDSGQTNVTESDVASMSRSKDQMPINDDGVVIGSNVSLEKETLLGIKTNLTYTLMARAYDNKVSAIRDVLRTM
jgi:flagellar basal-body rod protein FlgB